MYGGDSEDINVEIVDSNTEIEVYEPKITRKQLSIYEYCRVVTELANFLYNIDDIDKYIEEIEIKNIVDPGDLAFKLLESGKFDAVLDRGYEKVTFSKCKFNKIYLNMVRSYLEKQNNSVFENIFRRLKLAD